MYCMIIASSVALGSVEIAQNLFRFFEQIFFKGLGCRLIFLSEFSDSHVVFQIPG